MEIILEKGLRYTASSLEDIAQQLDKMRSAALQATSSDLLTQRERRYREGEAAAYGYVAEMLRATTLVNRAALLLAMEYGFLQHEKGYNLEGARSNFNETLKGKG